MVIIADRIMACRAPSSRKAAGRGRARFKRPGDRLDAHGAPLPRRADPRWAAQPPVSVSVSFTADRRSSPATARSCSGRSRTVADLG